MSSLLDLGRVDLVHLAEALKSKKLRPPYSAGMISRYVSPSGVATALAELERLNSHEVDPQHIGFTVELLAKERAQGQAIRDRLSIVWTGPAVSGSTCRDSASVARELLGQARHNILLSSYTVDPNEKKLKGLLGPLAQRMDALPNLDIKLFLNIPRKWKNHKLDDRPSEVIIKEFSSHFVSLWPGKRTPSVFYDPRALSRDKGPRACLHAKTMIVDHCKALVTSANLTEAAHERNIEAGVLIDDPDVARDLERQYLRLVDAGRLVELIGVGEA